MLCNQVLKARRKLHKFRIDTEFLEKCIRQRVVPKSILSRIRLTRNKVSPALEKLLLEEEIQKLQSLSPKTKAGYNRLLRNVRGFLSPLDFLRLLKYLSEVDKRKDDKISQKNDFASQKAKK